MGLVDWFVKRRMAKESASGMNAEQAAAVQQQLAAAQAAQAGQPTQITALSDIGALLSQWQQFQQVAGQGAQVTSSTQVFDMRGTGMRDEILAAVQAHGVPTDGSQVIGFAGAIDHDPHDLEGLQGDILGVLAKHGIDVDQLGVEQVPGAPVPADPTPAADLPPIQDPLRRR